jgi:hypothetical protein
MEKKILLNSARNADSENISISVGIPLSRSSEEHKTEKFSESVNLYNKYLDERQSCDKMRLTMQIDLLASNVLFNSVTEIVKNEGSGECECLNFSPKLIESTYGRKNKKWGEDISECIRDTQISYGGDEEKNYTYLCGSDIFNNAILRSDGFMPSYLSATTQVVSGNTEREGESEIFNTIADHVRDRNGNVDWKLMKVFKMPLSGEPIKLWWPKHMYNKSNTDTFSDAISKKLVEKDGWVGFYNRGRMDSYTEDGVNLGIANVINNQSPNSFIDLFPGRDRFSINPHYNKHRNRIEKNWEYCLTYPYSSTTEDIPFINEGLGTLKIAFITEKRNGVDGVRRCILYSYTKHGLSEGDTIDIYKSTLDGSSSEIAYEGIEVSEIVDDYTFAVLSSEDLCEEWVSIYDTDRMEELGIVNVEGTDMYSIGTEEVVEYERDGFVNADMDVRNGSGDYTHIGCHNLSFARTYNGKPSKYYVRLLSRLPNLSFMKGVIDDISIYKEKDGEIPVEKYAQPRYEFQSTQTSLSYARNTYGDNEGQIVYNEDICFGNIKDNLGRPVSSLYMTFVKTNYGFREWYTGNVTSRNVEYSRCFGKVTCGFLYSPHIEEAYQLFGNIRTMANTGISDKRRGLGTRRLRYDGTYSLDDDEISVGVQKLFYGDLCEYSEENCTEIPIQQCCYRFNTAQRELHGTTLPEKDTFKPTVYDEIVSDDDTPKGITGWKMTTSVFDNTPTRHNEGYYYEANYEIPFRTFSGTISEFIPHMIPISSISSPQGGYYTATAAEDTYINMDDILCVYDSLEKRGYMCTEFSKDSVNKYTFKTDVEIAYSDSSRYFLYLKKRFIPSYAQISDDGSQTYRWRDVIENGFEDSDGLIEEYPFLNGSLYVNRRINIMLRRQDPFGTNGLSYNGILFGLPSVTGVKNPVEYGESRHADDTFNERDTQC